jgi:hypothetical protein
MEFVKFGLGLLWVAIVIGNHVALVRSQGGPDRRTGFAANLPKLTPKESLWFTILQIAIVGLWLGQGFLGPSPHQLVLLAVEGVLVIAAAVILLRALARPAPRKT